jgi:hypothetical protein
MAKVRRPEADGREISKLEIIEMGRHRVAAGKRAVRTDLQANSRTQS